MIFYLKTQGGWRETSQIDYSLAGPATGTGDDARRVLADRLDMIVARHAALASGQDTHQIGWTAPSPDGEAQEDACNSRV